MIPGTDALASLPPAHLVGAGGAVGAVCRYGVGEYVDVEGVPLSTFAVNVLGTFALGLVTFLGAGDSVVLFVGTGVCGAFTTFSSFSYETVRLYETGERARAVAYASGTLLAAGLALALAWGVSILV
ncbi:MAG: fluoride efflux transporter CrcB [Haloglomus sp.]